MAASRPPRAGARATMATMRSDHGQRNRRSRLRRACRRVALYCRLARRYLRHKPDQFVFPFETVPPRSRAEATWYLLTLVVLLVASLLTVDLVVGLITPLLFDDTRGAVTLGVFGLLTLVAFLQYLQNYRYLPRFLKLPKAEASRVRTLLLFWTFAGLLAVASHFTLSPWLANRLYEEGHGPEPSGNRTVTYTNLAPSGDGGTSWVAEFSVGKFVVRGTRVDIWFDGPVDVSGARYMIGGAYKPEGLRPVPPEWLATNEGHTQIEMLSVSWWVRPSLPLFVRVDAATPVRPIGCSFADLFGEALYCGDRVKERYAE